MSDEIVGVCQSLIDGGCICPVHGLRHPPKQQTSGRYVWTGEASDAGTFFRPLHASHLVERCPQTKKHLRLPPGSRFLIAPGYETSGSTLRCLISDNCRGLSEVPRARG